MLYDRGNKGYLTVEEVRYATSNLYMDTLIFVWASPCAELSQCVCCGCVSMGSSRCSLRT